MNLRPKALKAPDYCTDGARRRKSVSRCCLVVGALLLFCLSVAADERRPVTGTAAGATDDFPPLDDLPPLLRRGDSSDFTFPSIDDPDASVIPRRSRDFLRPDARERNPGESDPSGYLPPVGDDRSLLPDDRSLPLRDPFAPAQPRRNEDRRDPVLPAENGATSANGFDWSLQPVTLADLEVGHPWAFEHKKPNLSEAEMEDYIRLIRAAKDRKSSIGLYLPDDVNITSAWESAFYRFAEARRQAWNNGTLLLQPARSGLADPFDNRVLSTADKIDAPANLKSYSLTADMQSHPSDFVGRPVVLYGLFTPSVINQLQAKKTTGSEKSVYKLQRGFLRNLSNTADIAIVDAEGFVGYDSQKKAIEAWPVEQRIHYPVMVKGWFVKTMGGQPLVYCDVVRILTPRPYDEYIRDNLSNRRDRRRVSEDESWLYYETLRQLQLTRSDIQAGIALADQQLRVKTLMGEVGKKAKADRALLENRLKNGAFGDTDSQNNKNFQARLTRLERQFDQRLNRYREYQLRPDTFPMFVDVFQHPDRWQGHLVTLRGHVRRVTSHEGDPGFFNGQPLHELWLFTDDSQHNPTVIVTPSLPDEFPHDAAVVDSVTVTGCLFKMYVYKSQDENRIAPLLLAGRIDWHPTNDQILALGSGGHFAQGSRLLATAKENSGNPVSDTMVLLFGFISLLATMTVWGRVQRDRRERERLKLLVDERPDFRQTSQDMYSGPFAESRYEPTRG